MRINSKYPICDADIWVYLCLSEYCDRVIKKYGKLIFADVVEKEILAWELNNAKYKKIATDFKRLKVEGYIVVIYHHIDIEEEDREYLEEALRDLDFTHGLSNTPKEKNKGEFVSALYADYFELPFLHTNDKAFKVGGRGKKDFPQLEIRDWYDVVEEFGIDQDEKLRVRKLVIEKGENMQHHFVLQKEKDKTQAMMEKLMKSINLQRL